MPILYIMSILYYAYFQYLKIREKDENFFYIRVHTVLVENDEHLKFQHVIINRTTQISFSSHYF